MLRGIEGLVADASGDVESRIEVGPSNLRVESGRRLARAPPGGCQVGSSATAKEFPRIARESSVRRIRRFRGTGCG